MLTKVPLQGAMQPLEPGLHSVHGARADYRAGRDGKRLDVVAVTQAVSGDLWQGKVQIASALSLVLLTIRPVILADLGFCALVAEERSDFGGSAPHQVQNIRAGAA